MFSDKSGCSGFKLIYLPGILMSGMLQVRLILVGM
jgi:hypothetical protein